MFNSVYNRVRAAAAIVLATVGLGREIPMGAPTVPYAPSLPKAPVRPRAQRNARRKARSHGSTSFKPNGRQECARRVRQIEAGTLTSSNGLIRPNDGGWLYRVNSHGQTVYS